MLISDSHEFIFPQVRKTASSSMQQILRPLCIPPPSGLLARLKSRTRLEWDYHAYKFPLHADILSAKRRMPSAQFERYFKFAFVRNPWERLVSEYEYILNQPDHGRHRRVRAMGTFADFIHLQISRSDAYQINMLCDSSNKLLVDFLGRFERLDDDWASVCRQIGIPHRPLPHRNATARRPLGEYYDDDSIALVARHWATEIEMFGYRYPGSARPGY
ncbi:MAG: sulfotransferase family 2 domain-containing protein [Lysobacterales bacterium]|jgi:hypothetical protein